MCVISTNNSHWLRYQSSYRNQHSLSDHVYTPTFRALPLPSPLAGGSQQHGPVVVEHSVSVGTAIQSPVTLSQIVVVAATVFRLGLGTHRAAVADAARDAALTAQPISSTRRAVDFLARRTLQFEGRAHCPYILGTRRGDQQKYAQ